MELQEYASIFLRRKWMIVLTILFILLGASIYCVVTPEQYKSSTTILIIPQTVPTDYVKSTISMKVEEQLATIRQQVLSRTTLTKVMEELGLFPAERKKLSAEEMMELMRKRIEIDVVQGKRRDSSEAFTLSFNYENRQGAMLTTSRLASIFIDQNLKTREEQAVGTSEFLESQLKETKARLEAQEAKVKEYKMRFMGELPQQMEANLRMLTGLQDRLRANGDTIRATEDRRAFLEAQVNLMESSTPVPVAETGRTATAPVPDSPQALRAELAIRKARLADLKSRYTDRYPEIVRAKQGVEDIEKRLAELQGSASTDGKREGVSQTTLVMSPAVTDEMRRMRAQVEASGVEIQSLKRARAGIEKNIEEIERKVASSPRREQEMISLVRDYENQKKSYDDLLKKKLEADISQNLERRQKGTQFQILDPANLPEEPFKPDRLKVMAVAILSALVLGFGGALLLEMLDPTIRGLREFKHFFQVPVLACIPVIRDEKYAKRQALRRAGVLGGLVLFTGALSVFLLVYSSRIRTILNF
jgi:polysaccharide chain length determinant protein (PEP-CTERM system associated)